jgi:biofilm PGA synthesis N-glycosyltransferase PgaC
LSAPLPLRSRVARASLLATGLGVVAIVVLVIAVWVAIRTDSRLHAGWLPVGIHESWLSAALLLVAGAIATACFVGFAALHAAAAMRVLARDRRIPPPLSPALREVRGLLLTPLGPGAVGLVAEPEVPASKLPDADETRPPLRLTVLVPAYNEELTIDRTLTSLEEQTRPPDRIIVVADNCTDRTAEIALVHGAEVFATVANTEKKAGALNQAFAALFQDLSPHDVAMVMDADSIVVPEFLETAMGRLEDDPWLIAVGGVFYGERGSGLIGQLQRNEYTRYQRDISRRQGRVFVLTGTASLFRTYALKAVADSRGQLLPGDPGTVYDTLALTEDNEMTLSLKTLGAKMVSPMQCHVTTELMPNWHALWKQRMRWQRGALENIGAYGLTRTTLRYWFQQTAIGYGTLALNSYLFLVLITLLAADGLRFAWFWLAVGSIFMVERVVTVWAAGWKARLLALPLVIEIAYDLVLQAVYLKSLVDIASGRKAGWNYVPRESVSGRAVVQ